MNPGRLQLLSSVGNGLIALGLLTNAEAVPLEWYAWSSIGYLILAPALRAWISEAQVFARRPTGLTVHSRGLLAASLAALAVLAVLSRSPWPLWLGASISMECTRLGRKPRLSWLPEALFASVGAAFILTVIVMDAANLWLDGAGIFYFGVAVLSLLLGRPVSPAVDNKTRAILTADGVVATAVAAASQVLAGVVAGPVAVSAMRVAASVTAPVTSLATVMLVHGLSVGEVRRPYRQLIAILSLSALVAGGLVLGARTGLLSDVLRPYAPLMLLIVASTAVAACLAMMSAAAKLAGHWWQLLKWRALTSAVAALLMVGVVWRWPSPVAIVAVELSAAVGLLVYSVLLTRRLA